MGLHGAWDNQRVKYKELEEANENDGLWNLSLMIFITRL